MKARILEGDQLRTTENVADIRAALEHKLPMWIQLDAQNDEATAFMRDVLKLHSLTIEDIWASRTSPKLEDYDNYLYAIVHGVRSTKRGTIQLFELDIVIGATYVLSHDPGGLITKDVDEEMSRSPRMLAKGPAWLAHTLLDHAVDRYLPVIDQLDGQIEAMQDDVLKFAGTKRGGLVLRRILRFKRMLQELRRMSIHQREILLRFARGDFDEIPHEAVPFYRDVYDHFLRVNDLIESYRDLVTSALEAYLSVQSNRMNEIMKTLTLIATVMLPLTFIAGVYGMNFAFMPELHWKYGYPYALGLMAAVTTGCMWWFRRKGWIGQRVPELPEEDEH